MKNQIMNISKIRKMLVFCGLFLFSYPLFSQISNQEKAYSKGMEAIKLMDKGDIEGSLKLLKEAKKLDPNNINYPYETAYAYYLKKDYKAAIKILSSLTKHNNIHDLIYQLLGNSYSMSGNKVKAIETYEKGLELFPNSGILYLERGSMERHEGKYLAALSFYEKGIEVAPKFPSNYYWATIIFCNSSEKVWGMIYGELFMNLERNSKRTQEISKLLYESYINGINITSDTSRNLSFSKVNTLYIDEKIDPKDFRLPFSIGVYEPLLLLSSLPEKTINFESLHTIRNKFIEKYYESGHSKNYPILLFTYQKTIYDAGHFEAYSNWILMKGDENGFIKWKTENKEKWENFVTWFGENSLKIDNTNKFHRNQYDK